jgi:MoxR-like ATPase
MRLVRIKPSDLVPDKDPFFVDTGLVSLLDSLSWGDPLILKGPTGAGKTLALEEWCARMSVPMIRENCNTGTDETHLIGSYGMEGHDVFFTLGSLPTAIETANDVGHAVLVLEEVNTLRPQVQSMMFSVADYRKSVECASLGRRFTLAKEAQIWVVGTMNPGYSGTYQLNQALRSRFDFCEVGYMPQAKERKLLEDQFTSVGVSERQTVARLITIAEESRTNQWEYALSTRDLVYVIRKSKVIGLPKALKMMVFKFDPEFKEKIYARVQSAFGVNLNEVELYG